MLKHKDKEGFIDFITNGFDESYQYDSKQKEIDARDFRVEKPRMSDVNSRYDEFKSFEQSSSYKNTQIATNLLSNKFPISSDQLSTVLKTKYNMSQNDVNAVLNNIANHKDVDVRRNLFSDDIKIKKRG